MSHNNRGNNKTPDQSHDNFSLGHLPAG